MKLGAYDYLQKPFPLKDLEAHRRQGLPSAAICARKTRSSRRSSSAAQPADRHDRPIAGDAGGLSADRAGRAERQGDSDPGRKRHGQGTGRPRPAPPQQAGRQADGRHQLRGAARDAAGKRTVRAREGFVHRGDRRQAGAVRSGRRRHAVHRRDRRAARLAAGQAAARAGGRLAAAHRLGARAARQRAAAGGDQSQPGRGSAKPAAFARTCTIGST